MTETSHPANDIFAPISATVFLDRAEILDRAAIEASLQAADAALLDELAFDQGGEDSANLELGADGFRLLVMPFGEPQDQDTWGEYAQKHPALLPAGMEDVAGHKTHMLCHVSAETDDARLRGALALSRLIAALDPKAILWSPAQVMTSGSSFTDFVKSYGEGILPFPAWIRGRFDTSKDSEGNVVVRMTTAGLAAYIGYEMRTPPAQAQNIAEAYRAASSFLSSLCRRLDGISAEDSSGAAALPGYVIAREGEIWGAPLLTVDPFVPEVEPAVGPQEEPENMSSVEVAMENGAPSKEDADAPLDAEAPEGNEGQPAEDQTHDGVPQSVAMAPIAAPEVPDEAVEPVANGDTSDEKPGDPEAPAEALPEQDGVAPNAPDLATEGADAGPSADAEPLEGPDEDLKDLAPTSAEVPGPMTTVDMADVSVQDKPDLEAGREAQEPVEEALVEHSDAQGVLASEVVVDQPDESRPSEAPTSADPVSEADVAEPVAATDTAPAGGDLPDESTEADQTAVEAASAADPHSVDEGVADDIVERSVGDNAAQAVEIEPSAEAGERAADVPPQAPLPPAQASKDKKLWMDCLQLLAFVVVAYIMIKIVIG